jgi:hypothetical protein
MMMETRAALENALDTAAEQRDFLRQMELYRDDDIVPRRLFHRLRDKWQAAENTSRSAMVRAEKLREQRNKMIVAVMGFLAFLAFGLVSRLIVFNFSGYCGQ